MDWNAYFMGFAAHAAKKSKDSTKVGAALIGPDGNVRLTSYNGPPKGVPDTPDKFERPKKYFFACHAEFNIVAFAAKSGISTDRCAVYVTHFPCSICARSMAQAGIHRVVAGDLKTSMPEEEFVYGRQILNEAGVEIVDYKMGDMS